MASRGRGARLKGSNFEREIANLLSAETGIDFQRGIGQSRGGGAEIADVCSDALPTVHFELKRQKRCSIRQAYLQALGDVNKTKTRIIITKDDREDTLVTMELSEWLVFFKAWLSARK